MPKLIKKQDNRREFIDTLIELAEKDDKIFFIIPDVGFLYVEEFQKRFPDRFLNTGVNEQLATLVATAMAIDGWKVYLYSMINFILFRNFEMVRNGIKCHNANVKLLGVKGSAAYKFLGFSHNLLHDKEDINVCKNIGLKCHVPKTTKEVRDILKRTYKSKENCYIRL